MLINEEILRTNLADNLHRLRHSYSPTLSQLTLANRLDITEKSIWCYEHGIYLPSVTVLASLAYYFNVSTDELIGFSINTERRGPYGKNISYFNQKKNPR